MRTVTLFFLILPTTCAIRLMSALVLEPTVCDVVFIGAGHFTAGALIQMRMESPELTACVVDARKTVGGGWLDANSWSKWVSPTPTAKEMKQYYMHDKTGLQTNLTSGLAHTKDVLGELEAIYDWSRARMYLLFEVQSIMGSEVVAKGLPDGKVLRILARKLVVTPNYRNMNSFHDSATRHDYLLSLDLKQFNKFTILGNSFQAADIVRKIYESREDDQFVLEVLYRHAYPIYPLINCSNHTASTFVQSYFSSNPACHSCSDPVFSQNIGEYLQKARELNKHGGKSMLIDNLMEPRMQKVLHFREAQTMPEHSLVVGQTLILDARNDVSDTPTLPITGASKVAQPSLNYSNLTGLLSLFAGGSSPSVLRTAYAYMCILSRNNFTEPQWSSDQATLDGNYHAYQILAKKYNCHGHFEGEEQRAKRTQAWNTCSEE